MQFILGQHTLASPTRVHFLFPPPHLQNLVMLFPCLRRRFGPSYPYSPFSRFTCTTLCFSLSPCLCFCLSLSRTRSFPVRRLRDEQERAENSNAESLRLLGSPGRGDTDATSFMAGVGDGEHTGGGCGGTLGDAESSLSMKSTSRPGFVSSPSNVLTRGDWRHAGMVSAYTTTGRKEGDGDVGGVTSHQSEFDTMADEGEGNFDDEFDPILASIRKPPQFTSAGPVTGTARAASAASSPTSPPSPESVANTKHSGAGLSPFEMADERGKPTVGARFASGFLSMFPGDIRARAGDVMAQSSARISQSASALRTAIESGTSTDKRRQSDPCRPLDARGFAQLEEGKGKGGAAGRHVAGDEGEEDVRMVNVDELLSEEEVRRDREII